MSQNYCGSKMNPNLKICCFVLVLLESAVGLLGLRFEQLVKFSCEICNPLPDECCVGTVIHKDVILTTSYCATSCQSIHKYDRNIEIIKMFKQPRMEAKTRHDIALVIVNIDWKLNGFAKLSFVDPMSAVALNAYFPFMDDGNTRMREITVSTCGKQGQNIYGNHVCGSKNFTRTGKKCFQRQGVPLLLKGRIIAIAAATNNKLCNDDQIVFNTVSPELSWIKSTIAELYPHELNELEADDTRMFIETPARPLRTFTIKTSTLSIPRRTPTPTQYYPPSSSTQVSSTQATTTTGTPATAAPTESISTGPAEAISTVAADPTEPAAAIFSTQTDAMEWFNQKVRNKMKSGNYSYFVLTTTKRVYTTPFVDLTV